MAWPAAASWSERANADYFARILMTSRHHVPPTAMSALAGGGGDIASERQPQVESVFELASLVLYGAQAIPIRLKILLDRLFCVLPPEDVTRVISSFGWSYDDYLRGYKLQVSEGRSIYLLFLG